MGDLKIDLIRLAKIKRQQDELAEQRAELEATVAKRMEESGAKTVTATTEGGEVVKGTFVQAERVILDEDKLRKKLDAKAWNKVTTRKVDREKVEAAVAMGVIDPNIVAEASEIKKNRATVRISVKAPASQLKATTAPKVRAARRRTATAKA